MINKLIIFFLLLSQSVAAQVAVTSSFKRNVTTNEVDVYIIAGQSNAQGYDSAANLPSYLKATLTGVKIFDYSVLTYSDIVAGTNTYGNLATGFGCEVKLGYDLKTSLNKSPYFIKYAVGGSYLAVDGGGVLDWNVSSTNENYNIIKGIITKGLNEINHQGKVPRIRAFIWMQGESDATVNAYSTSYQTNLENFISGIRTYVGLPNMPFVIGRINYPSATYRTNVRTAQVTVGGESNCYYIDTDSYPLIGGLHYSWQGQMSFSDAIYNIVKNF